MSLSVALQNAYSGLRVNTTRIEIASSNIANELTPNYARREVELSDARGGGVTVAAVTRAEAPALTDDRRNGDSDVGAADVAAETATTLSRTIGDPDDAGSLFSRYQAFEDSLRELSGDPAASYLQSAAVDAAQDVADGLNEAADRVLDERTRLDGAIGDAVDRVNVLLGEVERYNAEIKRGIALLSDTTELDSARSAVVNELSEYVGLQAIPQDDGGLLLLTSTGFVLVDDFAVTLDFNAVGAVTAAMDLDGAAPNGISDLRINGQDVTPGSAPQQVITNGRLSALFDARDRTTVTAQNQLDALARDLIARFDNTLSPGVEPAIAAGDPGLFSVAFGAAADPGVASQISLNPLVAADQTELRDGIGVVGAVSGDNTHVLALLDAFTAAETPPAGSNVVGSHGATSLLAQIVAQTSARAQDADETQALRTARRDTLLSAETAVIGVDTDKELQDVLLIQNAYAANAQVIQAVDRMLQEILEL